jgi:YHS domain-containing protein
MRTDDSGPSITHDGETYYFCSTRCKQSFEEHPTEFTDSRERKIVNGAVENREQHRLLPLCPMGSGGRRTPPERNQQLAAEQCYSSGTAVKSRTNAFTVNSTSTSHWK